MYPPTEPGTATPSDTPANGPAENTSCTDFLAPVPESGITETPGEPATVASAFSSEAAEKPVQPDQALLDLLTARATSGLATEDDAAGDDEWDEADEGDMTDPAMPTPTGVEVATGPVARPRRRKRQIRPDAAELRLQGRRAMCKRIADIAPRMGKLIKLRILMAYFDARRLPIGREDEEMTQFILGEAAKLADRQRVLDTIRTPGADFGRDDLKAIIFAVLLQEETFSTPERRLDEKVIAFEKTLVDRSKSLDLTEMKKADPDRWRHLDTYRIMLEAAWNINGTVSPDAARLLAVLRNHLGITPEDHWLISSLLKRFPKDNNALHTADEVNDARKDLQRQGLLWNYKDEDEQNVDVIPAEIAAVIRGEYAGQELQRVNYRRLVSHDSILLPELRAILQRHGLDRSGNKLDLIERVVGSGVKPSEVLNELDKDKLSTLCSGFGMRSSGAKAELVARLIDFYDDLTFEERVTRDAREEWYSNYELLARRAYAELRAKKLITKDLEIEHMFEDATAFLFSARLRVPCDMTRKDNRADGRLHLDNDQCILLDCKSAEVAVNLQDHLDTQFDGYLRKEVGNGKHPIGFLVIAPAFTPQSIRLAYQYKARTNWDVALITAEGLRHLADRWAATGGGKPFPVRLLNKTELIDKDRAEFLLSLA